ncbi:MAG: hypothetical protein D3926_02630, partial [Desulfobacteraceae bacterium]
MSGATIFISTLLVMLFTAAPLLATGYPLSDIKKDQDYSNLVGISPNGSHLVYTAKYGSQGATHLYSVPVDGGEPVRLSPDFPCGGGVATGIQPEINATSTHVVYRARLSPTDPDELFSVPITGGTSVQLNSELNTGEDISIYHL